MYFSRVFVSILLGAFPSLISASPIAPSHARRQDTVLAGFQLLGADGDCFDFGFDKDTFSATCISVTGEPAFSKIDLDVCMGNADGNLVFQFDPQLGGLVVKQESFQYLLTEWDSGNAFNSCSDCSLNNDTLDLTCNCATSSGGSQSSTINIGMSKELNICSIIPKTDKNRWYYCRKRQRRVHTG